MIRKLEWSSVDIWQALASILQEFILINDFISVDEEERDDDVCHVKKENTVDSVKKSLIVLGYTSVIYAAVMVDINHTYSAVAAVLDYL